MQIFLKLKVEINSPLPQKHTHMCVGGILYAVLNQLAMALLQWPVFQCSMLYIVDIHAIMTNSSVSIGKFPG